MINFALNIFATLGELFALYLIFGTIPTWLIIRWYRNRRKARGLKV